MNNNIIRIGLIGSVPPPIGGVTILFEYLQRALDEMPYVHVETVLIPVGSKSVWCKIRSTLGVARDVISILPKIDILTLHVPTLVLPVLGPLCLVLAKLYKTPFILRKFGGTDYTQFNWFKRRLSIWVVNRSEIYLAEARALVSVAKGHGAKRAIWYPNYRPTVPTDMNSEVRHCQRFVYIGQIRRVKGVMEIAEAAESLDLIEPIDIYGPFYDGITEDSFKQFKNVRYKGILSPQDVILTLSKYHALLLPTYHNGEGYPGVIFEAYSAGLPVICSKWKFLPEIVDETSGLLVAPRDAESLRIAMHAMQNNDALYQKLRTGAKEKAKLFSTDIWVQKFVEICHSL